MRITFIFLLSCLLCYTVLALSACGDAGAPGADESAGASGGKADWFGNNTEGESCKYFESQCKADDGLVCRPTILFEGEYMDYRCLKPGVQNEMCGEDADCEDELVCKVVGKDPYFSSHGGISTGSPKRYSIAGYTPYNECRPGHGPSCKDGDDGRCPAPLVCRPTVTDECPRALDYRCEPSATENEPCVEDSDCVEGHFCRGVDHGFHYLYGPVIDYPGRCEPGDGG